jgi:peptidyl-prolyl cis-trans isomerase B (cyclophilin B)
MTALLRSRVPALLRSCVVAFLRYAFASLRFRVPALLRCSLSVITVALVLSHGGVFAQRTGPLVVVETTRGTFAFDVFVKEAPLSVAHIESLVKSGFYDGQRVHRAVPGFVVQFGDPQTRDPVLRAQWGRGDAASSGKPVGVAEISLRRRNVAMSVGLAHMGDPTRADSQLYILLDARPELDGQYAVIGQVVEGEDVPARLQVGDEIRRVYVRE